MTGSPRGVTDGAGAWDGKHRRSGLCVSEARLLFSSPEPMTRMETVAMGNERTALLVDVVSGSESEPSIENECFNSPWQKAGTRHDVCVGVMATTT